MGPPEFKGVGWEIVPRRKRREVEQEDEEEEEEESDCWPLADRHGVARPSHRIKWFPSAYIDLHVTSMRACMHAFRPSDAVLARVWPRSLF